MGSDRSARGRRALVVGTIVGAMALGAATAYYLSPTQRAFRAAGDIGERVGDAFGVGAAAVLDVASDLREPYRCGFLAPLADVAAEPSWSAAGRTFTRRGWRLDVGEPKRPRAGLTIGVVADTHGDASQLQALRGAFADADVELVVSLGGHGRDADAIAPVLISLADARWPVLALPGATEAMPAHRAAIETARGDAAGPIVDGSGVRLLVMNGAAVATAPGAAHERQLEAASDGCVPSDGSLALVAAALADHAGARVIASHSPPTGPHASNVTLGGVRVGDPAVATLARNGRATAVVHGLVAETTPTEPGRGVAGDDSPIVLSAGAASGLPERLLDGAMTGGAALVVTVAGERVAYRPVRSSARP